MMPNGRRARGYALIAAQVLVLAVLAASARAMLSPTEIVHKSAESKRPKLSKNIVRAEPLRVGAEEKQPQGAKTPRPDANAVELERGLGRSAAIPELPREAYSELTKPDYLRSFFQGILSIPHGPPA